MRKRFFPCIITDVEPSGISRIRMICATVPTLYKSSNFGSSVFASFCATVPSILFFLYISLISFIDLFLPTEIGITTPGNNTVFLSGSIGSDSGILVLVIISSSSSAIRGIKSVSSFIAWRYIFDFLFSGNLLMSLLLL